MTTNHPVPTPPPPEPAPSLRPVEELQALCDRATPPPWNVGVRGGIDYTGEGWSTVEIDMPAGDPGSGLMLGDHELNEDDAAFIAAARTALPSLLARLRAAEETLARVERLAAIYERAAEVDPTGEFRKRAIDVRAALAEGASR